MKQKQKIWVCFALVSFILSSFAPILSNTASAATVSGYANEGVAFYAKSSEDSDFSPVYRLYKSSTAEHIYTTDETEKANSLSASYALEPAGTSGIAFYAHQENIVSGTEPQNIIAGTEPQNLLSGTEPQNILGGTEPQNIVSGTEPQIIDSDQNNTNDFITQEGLVPIYRLYNSQTNSRFYTASTDEKTDAIDNLSYAIDPPSSTTGIAFYAYSPATSASTISSKHLVAVYQLHNSDTGDYIYTASENEKTVLLTEISAPPDTNLGPEISVGLWVTGKSGLNSSPFKIHANKNYNIKDSSGNILAQVAAEINTRVASYTVTTTTIQKDSGGGGGGHHKKKKKKKKKKKSSKGKVLGASTVKKTTKKKTTKKKKEKTSWLQEFIAPTAYASDKVITTNTEYLKIYGDAIGERQLGVQELYFDAVDGNNTDLVFDVYRPDSPYDQYRGKMKIKYADDNNIWMINILPMEQYVWGMGEMSGTGPKEHSKVMTTIFRTYGYWYSQYATKYLPWGFRIRSDSGSQIYKGYDWEMGSPSQGIAAHPNIKIAAQETWGKVVTYRGEIALTPYSSWTDGNTRSFEEHWGSTDYPWCQSVPDPYGNWYSEHSTPIAAGNHMVGLSAHGSLNLAGDNYKWKYDQILKYYFTGKDGHHIDLTTEYNQN